MLWNPFDWTGGPFLALYLMLAAIVFVQGFRLRSTIGSAAPHSDRLSVFELAYLAGGARRLGDAILLSLTSAHGATIDSKGQKITVTDQRPLEQVMVRPPQLPVQPDMTRAQFQTTIMPIVDRVQERLQKLGYCPSEEQMMSFRMNLLTYIGVLLAFGSIKVVVGIERGRPVEFLIFLLFVTTFVGVLLARRPMRTQAGKDALESYRVSHERAARAPLENELLLAVALSGAIVLSDTAHAPVYAASQTMSSGSAGGCGGGGGGSCGGGGGGCGGCGGG
jgi:uncharacterized protein (TIGR04222 family)